MPTDNRLLPIGAVAHILVVAALGYLTAVPAGAVELEDATIQAFERYVAVVERQHRDMIEGRRPFLGLDEIRRGRFKAQRGDIVIESFSEEIPIPKALIHDWGGAAFIPGVGMEDVLTVLRDYDRHSEFYDEVTESKLLNENGDVYRTALRFDKKTVVRVVLATENEARFMKVADNRWTVTSKSIKISEVANPGTANERELPVGNDSGFLWRMYNYWLIEESDGGVYIQLATLALTRDVPTGLGWLVRPYIQSIPRGTLENMLQSTRIAVKKHVSGAAPAD